MYFSDRETREIFRVSKSPHTGIMGKHKRSSKGSDFLDDDCGQNALQLVARGSAIIAEILRLSEHIPVEFKNPQKGNADILCDFSYFTKQDQFEKHIQNSAELLQRDEDFRQTHFELLDRFFKLFRGVYGYVMELNRFLEEIREGIYISHTLESILVSNDGKQLLCEVFYLYGVMLLLLDYKIGGKVREHLIVSYIRYKGAGEQHTVEITSMCRSTGYVADKPLPDSYPVAYFNRVPVDKEVVGMLIGRIRSDDVYQMSFNYPAPEHRSTALAIQASILYILLFFRPEILHDERPVMREIVDKHFADNWVINYYMGFTVDLVVAWSSFKAASAAIQGTIALENVTYYQKKMQLSVKTLNKEIAGFLREGVLTEQYVLDHIHPLLLPRIRDANVALRWFILHMTRGPALRRYAEVHKKSYEFISNDITADEILTLLLQTAQLEFILKAMFTQFLKEKRGKWEAAKETGSVKMQKLATYFSGDHVLSDNVRVAQLETWFSDISSRISSLEYGDSTTASRKIQKLMKALENVQEFHQIDSNLQVVQFIQETRQLLRQMIRYINIERKVLITMSTVGDLSYAWELMSTFGCFVPEIQNKIKRNPHLAIQMRSAFVKLATMLELPCNRIDQAAGNDALLNASLESVSEYYSSELVTFVRKVLHIIPISIFGVLKKIVAVLVDHLKECPTKLPRKELKERSQLAVREELASHTADIAKFACGILAMESTLVGVIQVDPHQLLEDGIRKELVQQITHETHQAVRFDPKAPVLTAEEFDKMMETLARQLQGIRSSFEYIQDYVNVHGLRIWIEEFSRIVNFNVEMECNSFMQKKLYYWQSQFQSDSIPIPYFERASDKDAYSFLGKMVQHLLSMTDPRRCTYLPSLKSWYDLTSNKEVVATRTFTSICAAIGSTGLGALDRLLCFLVAKDLHVIVGKIRRAAEPQSEEFLRILHRISPCSSVPLHASKDYEHLSTLIASSWSDITDYLIRVGRIQLIRDHIANELRSACKLNSSSLFHALSTANASLLADLECHYRHPDDFPMPDEIIPEISPFLDNVGLCDAASKVYITSKPIPELIVFVLGVVFLNTPRTVWDDRLLALITKKKDDAFDATPFAMGLATLLRQFHNEQRDLFFGHLSQMVRVIICDFDHADGRQKEREVVPPLAEGITRMIELLATSCGASLEELHRSVPPQVLADCRQPVGVQTKK